MHSKWLSCCRARPIDRARVGIGLEGKCRPRTTKIAGASAIAPDRAAVPRHRPVFGAGRRLLGAAGRAARQVRGDGGEQPPADAARCARRAASCSTATARCSSRTATRTASRSSASTPRISTARSACWPTVLGVDEAQRARDRRPPPPRADATGRSRSCRTRRWRRWPRSRRAGSTSSCPTSSSSRCRRGAIRETMAAHLFGYVGEVNDAQVADDDELKSGDIVGQAGIEKVYNALLMGEDGAKRVVVNSVGREIRTLEEDAPTEGKRAAADASTPTCRRRSRTASRRVGLQRRGGDPRSAQRRGARRSPAVPAYDPNAFAAGIDRATWASLNTDELQAAAGPRDSGPLFAGLDVQDGGGARRRSKKASSRPDFKVHCAGHANFYGRDFKCWKQGRPRHDRSAPRDRAVVRRLLLHRRQHARRRQDQQVGDAARPRREERHRSAERSAGARAVDGVEARARRTRSGTRARRFRSAIGQGAGVGDAGVDGGLHGDARQRRHARHAAPAQGGRRRAAGWKPVPRAAAAVDGRHRAGQAAGDPRRAVDGRQRRRHRRPRAHRRATTSRARPARRRSSRTQAQGGRRARPTRTCATTAGSCSSRRATTRQIAGVVFLEHGIHGGNAAPVAHHILDTFFAKKDGRPLPPPPTHERPAPRLHRSVRARGVGGADGGRN